MSSFRERTHAITAIILAVAGFQAHIGEWLARPAHGALFSGSELKSLRWGPPYKTAREILMKRSAANDPSHKTWYRCLKGLHELRNHVAHYSPEKRDTGTFPARLQPYIEDGTFTPAGNESMDWTSRLIVRTVAKQAVEIANAATSAFDEGVKGWPIP